MTFVLSIFEWPLKTGFTVYKLLICCQSSSAISLLIWIDYGNSEDPDLLDSSEHGGSVVEC